MPSAEILTVKRQDSVPIFGEVEQAEMNPVDLLEQDLQKLKNDNKYNYMVGRLCGDAVQEVIDVCGTDATAEAIDRLSKRRLPGGISPSLYWLVRSVAEVTGQNTPEGRFSIIDYVETQLMSNQVKYNRRVILGEVDNEELAFQSISGYGQEGYPAKLASVESAIKCVKRSNFVVTAGAVACQLAHIPSETSSIGAAIEAGGFDRQQFLDNLHTNHGDMVQAYFANKHELEVRRTELIQQSYVELQNLGNKLVSVKGLADDDRRRANRLRDVVHALGIRNHADRKSTILASAVVSAVSCAERA